MSLAMCPVGAVDPEAAVDEDPDAPMKDWERQLSSSFNRCRIQRILESSRNIQRLLIKEKQLKHLVIDITKGSGNAAVTQIHQNILYCIVFL